MAAREYPARARSPALIAETVWALLVPAMAGLVLMSRSWPGPGRVTGTAECLALPGGAFAARSGSPGAFAGGGRQLRTTRGRPARGLGTTGEISRREVTG
jgi:hypothetical protein